MIFYMEVIIQRLILENPIILIYILFCSLILCIIFQLSVILKARKKAGNSKLRHFVWVYIFLLYLALFYHVADVGTIENLRNFGGSAEFYSSSFADDMSSFAFYLMLSIPLGVLLPLIWSEFRSTKIITMVSFAFSLIVKLSPLGTLQSVNIGDLFASTLGAVIGYLLFKGVYIFLNKGIDFNVRGRTSSFSIRYEAICYLILSFLGVFIFYHPLAMRGYFSNSTIEQVNFIEHEMRNAVLIPALDFIIDEDDSALDIPEDAFIIRLADLEGEYLGEVALCRILGTCYEGVLLDLSEESIFVDVSTIEPLIFIEHGISFSCELTERKDILICLENEEFEIIEKILMFTITDETVFGIRYIDGFGEVLEFEELSVGWSDLLFSRYGANYLIKIYSTKIEGEHFAEKVIIYRFSWAAQEDE